MRALIASTLVAFALVAVAYASYGAGVREGRFDARWEMEHGK